VGKERHILTSFNYRETPKQVGPREEMEVPSQSMRDSWFIDGRKERFFSQHFGLPLSVLFHKSSIIIVPPTREVT
jgi:hypothetical protein